jgi:hypothetical protein
LRRKNSETASVPIPNCLNRGVHPTRVCQTCGSSAVSSQPLSAIPPSVIHSASSIRPDSPHYGVGGWLPFLIFSLIFLRPLVGLWVSLHAFHRNMNTFSRSVHPLAMYIFHFVAESLYFAVLGYGIFAGIQLWRKNLLAVKHAKRALLYLLLVMSVDYLWGINRVTLMSREGFRATALANFLWGKAALSVVRIAIYVAVWYSYLLKSERVRATFGPQRW